MDKRMEREILATHADQLNTPGVGPPPNLSRHDRVQGLLDLAEHLQAILAPVEPDAHFRRRLHGELVLEAQRRQLDPGVSFVQQHRKGILIGSVASVVGVIVAFLLRYRHGRATHIATG